MDTAEQILALVQQQQRDLDLLKRVILPLVTRPSTAQLAREAKCHPSTLWRRRKRAQAIAAQEHLAQLPKHRALSRSSAAALHLAPLSAPAPIAAPAANVVRFPAP